MIASTTSAHIVNARRIRYRRHFYRIEILSEIKEP